MNLEILKGQIITSVEASQDEALLQNMMEVLSKHKTIIDNNDLTKICMTASEKSLPEAWDNEEDERWNAFLKN